MCASVLRAKAGLLVRQCGCALVVYVVLGSGPVGMVGDVMCLRVAPKLPVAPSCSQSVWWCRMVAVAVGQQWLPPGAAICRPWPGCQQNLVRCAEVFFDQLDLPVEADSANAMVETAVDHVMSRRSSIFVGTRPLPCVTTALVAIEDLFTQQGPLIRVIDRPAPRSRGAACDCGRDCCTCKRQPAGVA